ncbi:hypothetical protein CUMW_069770 [Citrus unshiu]|nr:hypothetical protein CUMW_069770 [Citrus unshiu]
MARPTRRKSSPSDKSTDSEFFKVYLPAFSSKQLAIPPAFAKHLNVTVPKHVIIRDYAGRQWRGKMEEVEGVIVIKDCWERFACVHSLELGDFLVFKYNGSSLFDVKIYGINGCLKEGTNTTHHKKETPIADMNAIPVKKEIGREAEQTSIMDDPSCNQDDLEIMLISSGKRGGSSVASRVKTRLRGEKDTGEDRAFKAARFVVPKNPHFVSVFSQYSRYAVNVSVRVVRSHGIKLEPEMMLRDQNGRKWPVKISFRTNGRIVITGGWSDFWREQKLEAGDKCVFEFVLSRGNMSKEMKVQVVRKMKTCL